MQLSLENKERHDVNTGEVLPNHDPNPMPGIQNEEFDTGTNLADIFYELEEFSEDNHTEGSQPYCDPIDVIRNSGALLLCYQIPCIMILSLVITAWVTMSKLSEKLQFSMYVSLDRKHGWKRTNLILFCIQLL